MSPDISERSFEEAVECGLLRAGPDACPGEPTGIWEASSTCGDAPHGGYHRRKSEECDRGLCLLPQDVVDSVLAT